MDKGTLEAGRELNLADLKELAFISGPCLTIAVPLQHAGNTARQNQLRLKSAVQAAEPALARHGLSSHQIREFLHPVSQVEAETMAPPGSVVIFRSKDVFRYFQIREEVPESTDVADHLQILPFLRSLQEDRRHFYTLALSQGRVRLLRCTNHSAEEIPLGPGTPASMEEWLNTRTPAVDQPAGEFTSTQDRDNADQHLANFFHRVNEGLNETLRGDTAPLVIAAVDYEATMFRGICSYANVAAHHVQGSPDSLKGGELNKRALEAAVHAFEEPMRKALQNYERAGAEKASAKIAAIVKSAHDGRVSHLFIKQGAKEIGKWDKATEKASIQAKSEDLLNLAALLTLANGGEVWVTAAENIPGGGSAAALLRY